LRKIVLFTLLAAALILSACAPAPTPAPTQDVGAIQTEAVQTAMAQVAAGAPTVTPPPPGATPDPNVPVAVVPVAVEGQPAGVANYNTEIMSGPGTEYVLYGALLGGASVQVVGISDDSLWWAINVPPAPNGQGWVSAAYLTTTDTQGVPVISRPPVPATTEMVPPGPEDPQATAIGNLYVRSGPAVNFPAYGLAPGGSTGRVIGVSEDGKWWVVRINPDVVGAGYGWVDAAYTTSSNTEDVPVIENPDTPEAVTPPPPAEGLPAAMAVEYVNVRTGPGTNYPVLGVAAPGAAAEVTGKSADDGWWQVKVPTEVYTPGLAWVSGGYVVTQNTADIPVVAAPPPPPPVPATPPPPVSGTGCTYVGQDPADGTTFTIGQPFTMTWMLQNTGSEAWDQAHYDFAFLGAYNNVYLHTGPDLYDLSTNVEPGHTFYFSVPMMAPTFTGTYGEAWQMQDSATGEVYCQFYVYINVP
jgi:uncharacterized protein YraI